MRYELNPLKVGKTRYRELGISQIGRGIWQVVDISDGTPSQIGPQFATKAELLAYLPTYAREFGSVDALG